MAGPLLVLNRQPARNCLCQKDVDSLGVQFPGTRSLVFCFVEVVFCREEKRHVEFKEESLTDRVRDECYHLGFIHIIMWYCISEGRATLEFFVVTLPTVK